ncbi:hypothetical protein [Algoriphagus pacificus]|uniref:Uncharacterized protein n=1 Tax=Algoriphagus pacificus TaxID=2811234 RepID=A0ABS3CKA7_9BACT|nr:hypothetical protein [Algoriphagus pacificus]MBN7817538.1 hypothetical protein [Algoriphagus pacificus]
MKTLNFPSFGRILLHIAVVLLYLGTIAFLFRGLGFIDVKDHNFLLIDYLDAGYFPLPPGYYLMIYLVDLIIRIKYPFVASSILVLTLFLWWKFKLLYSWLLSSIKIKEAYLSFIALGFLFLSPIYIPAIDGDFWYLGKFTQTIWHNSTLICVFPFCILLTKETLKWLENGDFSKLLMMFFWALAIILIKPSFLFCYIPTLPILILWRDRRLSSQLLWATGFSVLLFILLLVEKELIFSWDPMQDELYTDAEKSKVVFNPFRVWLYYSKEPIFDFVGSFPLVIVFFLYWCQEGLNSTFFKFTCLLLFFAIMVYLVFAETGFRELHGNFYWQIPIALFLNSLSILIIVLADLSKNGKTKLKHYIFFLVYVLQVCLGLGYWLRIFVERTLS